jgi:hypothetical protein
MLPVRSFLHPFKNPFQPCDVLLGLLQMRRKTRFQFAGRGRFCHFWQSLYQLVLGAV